MAISDAFSSLRGMMPGTSIKYTALPTGADEQDPVHQEASSRYYSDRHRKFFKMFMGGSVLGLILFMMISYGYVS